MKLKDIRNLRHRLYTYQELCMACKNAEDEAIQQTKNKFHYWYALAAINALASEPFKFGRGRLCTYADIMFGLVEGLRLKTVNEYDMMQVCNDAGIKIKSTDDTFEIEIDLKK